MRRALPLFIPPSKVHKSTPRTRFPQLVVMHSRHPCLQVHAHVPQDVREGAKARSDTLLFFSGTSSTAHLGIVREHVTLPFFAYYSRLSPVGLPRARALSASTVLVLRLYRSYQSVRDAIKKRISRLMNDQLNACMGAE